jgi:hypothetical protein
MGMNHHDANTAEMERLVAIPVEALALEVLAAIDALNRESGYAVDSHGEGRIKKRLAGIAESIFGDFMGRDTDATAPINRPVREALQRLEHANLALVACLASTGAGAIEEHVVCLTRLGEQAVMAGDAARYLGAPRS